MTLNGLATRKDCKNNLFYFCFFVFIISHFFWFFTFRIIFERTSYSTTVPSFVNKYTLSEFLVEALRDSIKFEVKNLRSCRIE